MERFDLIQVSGVVVACLKPSLFQARLPNGHHLLAHLGDEVAQNLSSVASEGLLGRAVLLELRAFDMSAGRVLCVEGL
jgi:translation initiation factor IF-1